MALKIEITDPATIELLARYKRFIKAEDGATGTMREVVEGLIIGSLDGHDRFANWSRRLARAESGADSAKQNNVTHLRPDRSRAPTAAATPDLPRQRHRA